MITDSRPADVTADKREVLEGVRSRLSMQVRINTDIDIWLRRLFAEIAHILG
jgi:hypothetical protein